MTKLRILHVEDNTNDSELVRAKIESEGIDCEFERVETQDRVITAVESDCYDIILCDYTLPSYDGLTALQDVRRLNGYIPFIFVSGTIGEIRVIDALKLGATDYVLKNDMARLVPSIMRALREAEEGRLRRQAEDLQHESEERHRIVTETATDGIITIDSSSTILFANPATEKIFGYNREDILGKDLTMLMPQYLRHVHKASIHRYVTTGTRHISWKAIRLPGLHKNGNEIPLEMSFGEYAKDGTRLFTGIVRDITEQMGAERTLRESEERYRLLFEAHPHPMWFFDAESLEFLAVNAAAIQHYGFSREEFLSMTLKNIRPEEEVTRLMDDIALKHRGFDVAGMWKHKKKDGTIIDVEITSHDLKYEGRIAKVALAQDVTKRVQAEKSLLKSERQLSSIYDTTADVIFYLSVEKDGRYRFISVNQAFVLTTGIDFAHVVGKGVDEIIPEPSLTAVLKKYAEAIRERKIVRWEETSEYPSGRLTGDVSVAPVFDDAGNCTHLVGAVHDITHRKQLETELLERIILAEFQATIAVASTGPEELQTMLRKCTDSVVETFGAAFARIWTLNDQEQMLELQASSGLYTHLDGPHGRVPVGKFKIGLIARERKPHLSNDVVGDPRVGDQEWARREGMVAFAGYPLCVEDRVVGVIALFSRRRFDEREFQALGTVSNTLALAIERKRGEENLRFQKMLLESQNEASIDGILIVNASGKIIWFNRRFVETWGLSVEILQSGSDEAAMRAVLDKLVSPEEFVAKVKYLYEHQTIKSSDEILLKDGRTLDRYSSPIEHSDGEYLGRVWLFRDITSRKQAEAGLELASSQIKNLHDSLDEALFSVDVIENRMLQVSNAHDVIFGYAPAEFFKNPRLWYELIVEEDKPLIEAGHPVLSSGKSIQHQFRIIRPDGQLRWIEARLKPTLDGSGTLVRLDGIASDITERKRTEQALIESQDRFRRLAEASSEVFWIFDPRKHDILYVSPAYEKVWGRTCQSLYENGMSFLEAIHPDDRARELEIFRQQAAGIPTDTEYRVVHPDGSIRWVWDRGYPARNDAGEVFMITGMAQDITERKQSGEKLRESEEQFRMIAENVADLIVMLDRNGNRLYNSPSYANLLGNPELLKGTRSFDEIHPDDREKIEGIFFDTVRTGMGHRAEYRFVSKDGSIRDIESNGSAIRDEHGNVSRVLVVSRDITEKKKLEAQFLRAQRMESLGALAGGIAHDLNNVLAPILMAVEILKKRHPDLDTQRILGTLESSAQRGSGMIRQVLTFARGIEGQRAPVQVGHLIREMEKIIRETFPKSIHLKTELPKDLWIISADATQLHQVLLNLCVNARDAMPEGGALTVRAENVIVDENYALMQSQAKIGPHIAITITDGGTGIPAHVIDKIFDPFFTTKEVGKGTGLGLSTVHSIVKSHGGFINVYSEMGKGTEFHIYIPAEPSGEHQQIETASSGLPSGNGELILVVDDEASIRDICQVTLETFGYRVVTASDGTEAVVQFTQRMNEIRLVITDMMMPFMDGRVTIRALSKLNPQIRIIASSGLTAEERSIDRRDLAIYAFLPKPYTAGTLLKTVSDVLAIESDNRDLNPR